MAQAYDPLTADRTFAASYLTLNSSDEALRTLHSGTTAPSSTVAYMLWVDTTNNLLKQRNSTNTDWITLAQVGVSNGGMLPTSGGTMSGNIAMASNKITDLGAPTAANDAARKAEMDLKAPLAAPAFTGDATVNQDPNGNDSITRRSWTEGRYLKLAGGTMTALFNLFADATSALHAVTLQQLKTFVLFNTSTGHRHDNVDARRVRGTDLDSAAEPVTKLLRPTGGGVSQWSTPNQPIAFIYPTANVVTNGTATSFQTVDVTSSVTADAYAVILRVVARLTSAVTLNGSARFRAGGLSADEAAMDFTFAKVNGDDTQTTTVQIIVELSGSKTFQWRVSSGSLNLDISLLGYFRQILT